MAALIAGSGCIEIERILTGENPRDPGSGQLPPDGGNGGGNGTEEVPVVRLTVSNPAPAPSEEVVFQCRIVSGDTTDPVFTYTVDGGLSGSDRLVVDSATGVARFIVAESDIGIASRVACRAETAVGLSSPSNEIVVVATGSGSP